MLKPEFAVLASSSRLLCCFSSSQVRTTSSATTCKHLTLFLDHHLVNLEYHLQLSLNIILHSSEYFGSEKNRAQRAQFIKRTAGLVCIARRCGAFAVRSLHMHNTHMHGQPDGMAFCKRAEAWLGSRDLSCTWKWYKDIFEHLMFSEFWLVERQKHYHFANLDINEIVKWIVVHKSLFSVADQNDVKKREIEVPLYSHGP